MEASKQTLISTERTAEPWIFLPYEKAGVRIRTFQRKAFRPLLILTVDLVAIVASLALAGHMSGYVTAKAIISNLTEVELLSMQPVTWTTVTWLLLFLCTGDYQRETTKLSNSTFDDLGHTAGIITVGSWLVLLLTIMSTAGDLATRSVLFGVAFLWISMLMLIPLGRVIVRNGLSIANPVNIPTIVVGAGEIGKSLVGRLERHREYGLRVVGFIDTDPLYDSGGACRTQLLGRPADLGDTIEKYGVKRVIIAFSKTGHQQVLEMIGQCRKMDVDVSVVPRYFGAFSYQSEIEDIEGLPVVSLPGQLQQGRLANTVKRATDLVLACLATAILAPLLIAIAILIKLDSPGPVVFSQKRMGLDGRVFRMYKFRSMIMGADKKKMELSGQNDLHGPIFKIKEDPRMTRVGRLIRKLSLDELPQLINVFKGEMSLVGPRPLILKEARQCRGEAKMRHGVKPGITGLWQTLGRSEIPYDEMMQLDSFYVRNWTLMLDLKIIFHTFFTVLRKKGAY